MYTKFIVHYGEWKKNPLPNCSILLQIILKVLLKRRRCLTRSATPPESGGKSLVWGFVPEALSRSSIDLCGDAVKI
jgi:hypothetical protein